jgi:hypothetical protein
VAQAVIKKSTMKQIMVERIIEPHDWGASVGMILLGERETGLLQAINN